MGLVGVLVRDSVTTKLWPSQPLVDNRSGCLVSIRHPAKSETDYTHGKFAMLRLRS